MKLKNGVFRMCHDFCYGDDADLETKAAVIRAELEKSKKDGFDGIVTNAPFDNGYLSNPDNLLILRETVSLCKELGLRVWIYDEKRYPSGAAGTLTLGERPDAQAKALAAVYRVLAPGESTVIALPHGHLGAVAAFGFFFDGKTVPEEALRNEPMRAPLTENGFEFENDSEKNLLCLAFFTKHAFEGTHCQHNAAVMRRYIDIADPAAAECFINNTYAPYVRELGKYFADGTVEAFFFDEPSFMGAYFNLKKQPRQITHLADPELPLWASVSWSRDLPEKFEERFGYSLTDRLPSLFVGSSKKDKAARRDFYTLLSELAEKNFFRPVAEFCCANGARSSGHLLLEERITDHPRFAGDFFTLLRNQHVPGMDMLDSLPERVRSKASTPLLISSVSRIYADGDVMDEVSAHFQLKFGVNITAIHVFNSLVMQYCLGANIFHSYYGPDSPLFEKTPAGDTVLRAFKRTIALVGQTKAPKAVVHYPIEAVNADTSTPVDTARVFDSSLNEAVVPYPIDRRDIGGEPPEPLIPDPCFEEAKRIEKSAEDCMNALLDRQIPLTFCGTEEIGRLGSPELFIVPAQEPPKRLVALLDELSRKGCAVIALTDSGRYAGYYENLKDTVVLLDGKKELEAYLENRGISFTDGDTKGVVALSDGKKTLFVNSENVSKRFSVKKALSSLTNCFSLAPVDFESKDGKSTFMLEPYAVFLAE